MFQDSLFKEEMVRWVILASPLLFLSVCLEAESYSILEKSWDLIKLQDAYRDNPHIRGAGVRIGIVDGQFNLKHPGLKGKARGVFNNYYDFVNSTERRENIGNVQHGTHVAGIILAAKQEGEQRQVPHGIAYQGSFYGVALLNTQVPYRSHLDYDLFAKNLKIINNSWGFPGLFPLINRYFDASKTYSSMRYFDTSLASISANQYFEFLKESAFSSAASLVRLSRLGILNIVASGNEGSISSSFLGAAAAYDESLRSWLVVGALDARHITKEAEQLNIIINPNQLKSGVAYFSNLFRGTALYGIMAPGVHIQSANAMYQSNDPNLPMRDKLEFIAMSGTSQATPMVSGAAMLVQQKFGFLNGAQIADVLLSTASYDNVRLPKLIVQSYYDGGQDLYHVVYIDQDPPKRNTGEINTDQVKVDLKALGYSDIQASKILAHLYQIKNPSYPPAEGIIRLEKHEVIGQGILNIQKALQGLARLDANRLNLKDILEFEGEKQAFYSLDTQGFSAEFSNDIDQRTWEDKWHLQGALNSPERQMRSIKKVGLLKKGEGTLTLSGNNSYQGATRIWGGTLEIKNGAKLASNVYAERNGAILSLAGSIAHNLKVQDGGLAILRLGSEVKGNAMVEQEGRIELRASSSVGGLLSAQDRGNIQFRSIEANEPITLSAAAINLKDSALLSGAGIIRLRTYPLQGRMSMVSHEVNALNNESGIVEAGFLETSGLFNPEENKLKIYGRYIHGKKARLKIAFSGDRQNSKLEADHYVVKGGTLAFVSAYDGYGLIRPNQKIYLELGSMATHTQSFDRIETQDNNLLSFIYEHEVQALSSVLKDEALRPTDQKAASVGEALRSIYSNLALSKKYENYFGELGQADGELYQSSVDSLAQNAQLLVLKDNLRTSKQIALNHLISSMDFYTQSLVLPSALKNKIFVEGNYAFSPYHDAKGAGLQVQTASNAFAVSLFAHYNKSQARDEGLRTYSHSFFGGISGVYDASFLSFVLAANGGVSLNQSHHFIIHPSGSKQAVLGKNKNYLASAQLGFGKDFKLDSLIFRPMALLEYFGILQGAYKEEGRLFARSYDAGINQVLGAIFGANMSFKTSLGRTQFSLSAFGFYHLGIMRSLSNQSSFYDFPSQSFKQSIELNRRTFKGGVTTELAYRNLFARLSLGSELGYKEEWMSSSLALGLNF